MPVMSSRNCSDVRFGETCGARAAIKNEVEKAGIRGAHVRDAVALCHYFAWLEELVEGGGTISELEAAEYALHFRAQQEVRITHVAHRARRVLAHLGCNGHGRRGRGGR